jgi:predicted anti-sigma-YlaC factor YlaD
VLTCKQMVELMGDYLEGRLSLGDRLLFQVHLGGCRHCRAYLKQMKSTVQTLGRLREEDVPEKIRDELLERFKSWKRRKAEG